MMSEASGVADRARRQRKAGVVVSDKMDKTVRVAVERIVAHPAYGKRVRRTSVFMAHDEENRCKVGDRVEIVETRPLSRRKRWRVTQILERGGGAPPNAEATADRA
jgi:small subunit ribosomal protein S17